MLALIEETADASGRSEARLPKGMDAYDFRNHLMAKGTLQPNGDGKLICPIPSLQDFLAGSSTDAPR